MADDTLDTATEPRPSPPSTPDIGSYIKPVTEGLTTLQREKVERTDKTISDMDVTLRRDQERLQQAYDATGVEAQKLKPWNYEQERAKFQTDPIEAFGSLGSVFGILASAFTHAPMENALNASAAAINAIKAGNDKEFERSYQAWKDNNALVVQRHQMMHTTYQDAVTLMKTNMAAGEARLQMEAARFGDRKALFLLENGMSEDLFKLIESRNKAAMGMLEAQNAITEDGMKKKFFEDQSKAIDQNLKDNPELAAAHKLAAWQTIFRADKQSPQQALMGRFFLEKPNATAEEAAEFARKNGIIHTYRSDPNAEIIQALRDQHEAEGKPPPTANEIAEAIAKSKGRSGSQGAQNLTTDRQRAQDVQQYREQLKAEKNEDGSAKYTPEQIAQMAAEYESKLKRTAAAPTGNQIDWMKGQRTRIGVVQDLITEAESLLKKHKALTGLGGTITRPAEVVSNWFGSNATDRARFESIISEIKEYGPRLLNESKGRPLASEAEKIDKIVRGTRPGDTTANTARQLLELRKQLETFDKGLEGRITGSPASPAAPAPSSAPKPWERDPVKGKASEIEASEMTA